MCAIHAVGDRMKDGLETKLESVCKTETDICCSETEITNELCS